MSIRPDRLRSPRPPRRPDTRGDRAVIEELRSRICAKGRITFAEFMDVALYHPGHGYYTRPVDVIGPEGDYYTSPYVHAVFGRLIGDQMHEMWQSMARPERFHIVEYGANKGIVCYDMLSRLRQHYPDFYQDVAYIIVEAGDSARSQVDKTAGDGLAEKITVLNMAEAAGEMKGLEGCVFSNELVDALPVHLVTWQDGELKEIYAGLEGDKFGEIAAEPSSAALRQYAEDYMIPKVEGMVTEINLRAIDWMKQVAASLQRGFVITIDYGGLAAEVYSPDKKHGTLACYYKHTGCDNPYTRVGLQDITAHVNFQALMVAGEEAGLDTLGFCTQSEFLAGLGLGAYLPNLLNSGAGFEQYTQERAAVMQLMLPYGLGGFRVLVQGKGVPGAQLSGLSYRLFQPDTVEGDQ